MKNKLTEDLQQILDDLTITDFRLTAHENADTEGFIEFVITVEGHMDERQVPVTGTVDDVRRKEKKDGEA